MSNLYVLGNNSDFEGHGKEGIDPWEPWYDKTFGFVIRADSEEEARAIAQAERGGETGYYRLPEGQSIPAWTDPKFSWCDLLEADGEKGVVLDHIRYA